MSQQLHPPWQPIATAPKTGKLILVWIPSEGAYPIWWCNEDGDDDDAFWRSGEEDVGDLAVLWRPLPPGPYETPENAELLRICKAAYEDLYSPGYGCENIKLAKRLEAAIAKAEDHDA